MENETVIYHSASDGHRGAKYGQILRSQYHRRVVQPIYFRDFARSGVMRVVAVLQAQIFQIHSQMLQNCLKTHSIQCRVPNPNMVKKIKK